MVLSQAACRVVSAVYFVLVLPSYLLLLFIFGDAAALGFHLISFEAGLAWEKILEEEKPH